MLPELQPKDCPFRLFQPPSPSTSQTSPSATPVVPWPSPSSTLNRVAGSNSHEFEFGTHSLEFGNVIHKLSL